MSSSPPRRIVSCSSGGVRSRSLVRSRLGGHLQRGVHVRRLGSSERHRRRVLRHDALEQLGRGGAPARAVGGRRWRGFGGADRRGVPFLAGGLIRGDRGRRRAGRRRGGTGLRVPVGTDACLARERSPAGVEATWPALDSRALDSRALDSWAPGRGRWSRGAGVAGAGRRGRWSRGRRSRGRRADAWPADGWRRWRWPRERWRLRSTPPARASSPGSGGSGRWAARMREPA